MAKRKEEKYAPLIWAESFDHYEPAVKEGLAPPLEEMKVFIDACVSDDAEREATMRTIMDAYPDFFSRIGVYNKEFYEANLRASGYDPRLYPIFKEGFSQEKFKEDVNDLSAVLTVNLWAKNKQVFKFDKDFTDELLATENVKFIKDLFDHLPFETFYIDYSDNKDLVDKFHGEGVFIRLSKNSEYYVVHATKVTRELFFSDAIFIKNEDTSAMVFTDSPSETKVITPRGEESVFVDRTLYERFLTQALTYLSSAEQDIRENETTKRTYRKPEANNIKNKFSEIRMQDVGIRFGTAFRTWTKKKAERDENSGSNHHTGAKQRPHFRRAHWHTYLYGKGKTERKVVWQHECAINMNLGTEQNVVLHKVAKEKKQTQEERE